MGTLKTTNIQSISGSGTVTLGTSGETIALGSNVSVTGNGLVGITVADQWRVNTNISAGAAAYTDITANWEQVDSSGQGTLGSAMTESSGIFTFPSTGIYLVQSQIVFYDSSAANTAAGCQINVTINNSAYTVVADTYTSNHSGSNVNSSTTNQSLIDVTDVSNVKVKMSYYTSGAQTIYCTSTANVTGMSFIRLGDT